MKCFIYNSLLGLLAFMLANCQKEEGPQVDISPPLIEIVQPIAEQNYLAGSSLPLSIVIEENQELHEYSVVLRNADRSYARTLSGGHLHENIYRIEETFNLPLMTDQLYTLTVKASDHNDNLTTESLTFTVK